MIDMNLRKGIDYTGISVGFYCHDGSGNFLFGKRSEKCRDEHGMWECGGGGLKFGETIEDALWRELEEEYGCSGEIDVVCPPSTSVREKDGVRSHWLSLPYIIRVDRAEVKLNEPEKMTEIGWFRLDNLPQPLHSECTHEIELHEEHFKKYL